MLKFPVIIGLFCIFTINAMEIAYDYGGRIVNGYDIEIKEVPYQVGLFENQFFACGGSIITEKFILTAAHCLGSKKLMVHAGSSKLKQGGSYHTSINVTIHENYNYETNEYDIGLIEIHPILPHDETREKIKLLKDPSLLKEGDMALVTGWGMDSEGGNISPHLQAVQVPIISHELCRKQYINEGEITERHICAGYPEGEKDSCQGDSGGPLVVHDRLAGIVSWGKGCARAKLPGVYTNVAYYIDWIEKHTGERFN